MHLLLLSLSIVTDLTPLLTNVKIPTEMCFSSIWSILRIHECGMQWLSTITAILWWNRYWISFLFAEVFATLPNPILLNKLFAELEELIPILPTKSGYLLSELFLLLYCYFSERLVFIWKDFVMTSFGKIFWLYWGSKRISLLPKDLAAKGSRRNELFSW